MSKTNWLFNAFVLWNVFSVSNGARAQESVGEGETETKAEQIDMNISVSEEYLPNVLSPVLMSHGESRANRVRAMMNGLPNSSIFGSEVVGIKRDGENFLIHLNEWHTPIRIEP